MASRILSLQLFCFGLMLVPRPFTLAGLIKKSDVPTMVSASVVQGTISMSSSLESMSSMGAAGVPSGIASGSMYHGVTALTGSSQTAGVSPTATQTSALPYETLEYDPVNTPDEGYKWGNATIVNRCSVAVNINTIGGFRLNGQRTDKQGYATPEEQVVYPIAPGGNYSEAFRSTWVSSNDTTRGWNPDTDKLWGQGIAIKVSWADHPHDKNITQFEYALTYNAKAQRQYPLLWYDVSLLDCGTPANGDRTDFTATDADYQVKTEQCPGYQGGLTVTFEPYEGLDSTCPEIACEGECHDIYNFDRTRESEPTKQCEREFKGNMILQLCAGEA